MTPAVPLPAAIAFRSFAPESAAASLLLLGWSLLLSLGGYLLLLRLFVRLGASAAALRWALALLLLAPVFAGGRRSPSVTGRTRPRCVCPRSA